MTPLIDVGAVLRGSVSDQYTNLVTRHTGRAVRDGIERELASLDGRRVTVIDFSHVGLLDYSCADEIVAQLLLRYGATADGPAAATATEAYFIFRGVGDHLDPIEHVLEHHGLAIVYEAPGGDTHLVGEVTEAERLAWHTVQRVPQATVEAVATVAGLPADACERALHRLWRRRLVLRDEIVFLPIGAVA
ncbi:MAG: STAS-like domain-containing protein [Gemmatimonadaceae bacterium]|nr:STAS-like domain-containing protein [Gemmatimonadaceae bacterium]